MIAHALDEASPQLAQSAIERIAESNRVSAGELLEPFRRVELGQFFTPFRTARLLASMFEARHTVWRLLDPGAGVGTLAAACLERLLQDANRCVRTVELTALEVDQALTPLLTATLESCRVECEREGIELRYEVVPEDFITWGESVIGGKRDAGSYHAAVLNPPYRKIRADSQARLDLRAIGIETTNLYAAFVAIAARLILRGGELVAITPRSFCNGPYFRPFRCDMLGRGSLDRLHVFESRSETFREDDVLQENVIARWTLGEAQRATVVTSRSSGQDAEGAVSEEVGFSEVVRPTDPDKFIHILATEQARPQHPLALSANLASLGLSVSTGRVVDFRATEFLADLPGDDTVPLIYPGHLRAGTIVWPREDLRKPNALRLTTKSRSLTVPRGVYVVVKRFSSKEERRRIVAAVYDSKEIPSDVIGFENHLNYFHAEGVGLEAKLARGLCLFLNSTLIDEHFRLFSGHTQVNATDLRKLPYPPREVLVWFGGQVERILPEQSRIDALVEDALR